MTVNAYVASGSAEPVTFFVTERLPSDAGWMSRVAVMALVPMSVPIMCWKLTPSEASAVGEYCRRSRTHFRDVVAERVTCVVGSLCVCR